jgi:hypothetical protein
MLAIVLAAEAFVATRDPAFSSLAIDMWADARGRAGSAEVRDSALLCFGDSQVQQGVLATVVGERLGVPACNLAVPAGQPAAAYALLRHALEAGSRPKAAVVGFFPGLPATDLSINARTWPEVLGPLGALDLAITGADAGLACKMLVGMALPSYRARLELRRNIAAALAGGPDPARDELPARRLARRAERGSMALPHNPYFLDEPGVPSPGSAAGLAWRPTLANERYLRRFLRLAAGRGVGVYWVSSPLSPNERARREREGLTEGYDRFLRRLQAEFPNLVVLETRPLDFDRAAFGDPYHLDGAGAAVLSLAVAEAIATGPASRQVALTRSLAGPAVASGRREVPR